MRDSSINGQHPLSKYSEIIHNNNYTTLSKVNYHSGDDSIRCAVMVSKVNEVLTRMHHSLMAFVEVEDLTGCGEVIFFPPTYKFCRNILKPGELICLTCKLDHACHDGDDMQKVQLVGLTVKKLTDL